MTFEPKIKAVILFLLLNFMFLFVSATVMGPIVIDVIGYDASTHSVYFTRTDWGECNCETDLYIYRTDRDTLEVQKNWASRNLYRMKRERVLEMKGLSNLKYLQTAALPQFVSLLWLPEVGYISKVTEAETASFPFNVRVFTKNYDFILCSKSKGDPQIVNHPINDYSGLILIIYQGDCFEGNLKEALIYYFYKDGKSFSRRLSPESAAPLKFMEMEKP